jgi:hypothetical protein
MGKFTDLTPVLTNSLSTQHLGVKGVTAGVQVAERFKEIKGI